MTSPAKPPSKASAKTSKGASKGSFSWLSIGVVCLLVGGTFGAKSLLLVDNDLEMKTKFRGKTWQLNSHSIRQYINSIENFTSQKVIRPVGENLRQQSSQILTRTGDILANQQDLCISTAKVSSVFGQAKSLNPLAVDSPESIKALASLVVKTTPIETPVQAPPVDRNWCITTGVKK
jgi:hypothetical protein